MLRKSVRQGGHRLCSWVLLWPLRRRSKPAIHGRSGLARLIPECPGVTPKRFRLPHQKRKPRRIAGADGVALGGPQKIAPQSKPGPRRAGKLAIALDAQKPHDDPRHTTPTRVPVAHGTNADAEQLRTGALTQEARQTQLAETFGGDEPAPPKGPFSGCCIALRTDAFVYYVKL